MFDSRGQGWIEYALILVLLVIVVVVIMSLIGPSLTVVLSAFFAQFTRAQIQMALYLIVGTVVVLLIAALFWQIFEKRKR